MKTCYYATNPKLLQVEMMGLRKAAVFAFFVGLLTSLSQGHAATITHTFTGTVDAVSFLGTGNLPFSVGAAVTGEYFYDGSTDVISYNDPYAQYPRFDNAQTGIYFTVKGQYTYGQSQANPEFSTDAKSNFVEFGPSSNPPELIDYYTSSLKYDADGLHTAGGYVSYFGDTGMISSYSPSTLAGLTVDFSKVHVNGAEAAYQTYTYANGGFTSLTNFKVHITSVDGVQLPSASVPEPSTVALMGMGAILAGFATKGRRQNGAAALI